MHKHVSKHINIFKCKYCERAFSDPSHVSHHCHQMHPKVEPKIESIKNYETLVQDLMSRVTGGSGLEYESLEYQAVAKKSTARPIVRVRPFPSKLKSVARKSTNPLPRYPFGFKFQNEDLKITGVSHYKVPRAPIDLSALNTYMVVGGHRMKVNCITLSQLMDIDPKVIVKDVRKKLKKIR